MDKLIINNKVIIAKADLDNYIVYDSTGTYYDADTLEEALSYCKKHGLEVEEVRKYE